MNDHRHMDEGIDKVSRYRELLERLEGLDGEEADRVRDEADQLYWSMTTAEQREVDGS